MAIANKGVKLTQNETAEKNVVDTATQQKAPSVPGQGAKTELAEVGKAIYRAKSEEEKAVMGSKSDDIEFIALITNPYFSVSRKKGGQVIKGEETVGAILKNVGTEPIVVKSIPNKSYNVMDADFENVTERTVAPGEEFQVNSIEVAELLTRDEYSSRITGGGKEVTYTTQTPKNPTEIPTTKLRIKGGSVKDFSVSIAEVSADGKTKTMKPEFEDKFAIFSTRGPRAKGVSGTTQKPKANPAGLAVQALFNRKLGKN